jgi:hypothetical protein
MKVQINKIGSGSVWSFRPTSEKAAARMRQLFKAYWSDGVMYVEHRYEIETAARLFRDGFQLTREEDDAAIEVIWSGGSGRFVLARRVA